MNALVETTARELGSLDVLVNNAGIVLSGAVASFEEAAVPGVDEPRGAGAAAALWSHWCGNGRFYQEPLYPYLIALVYRVAGPGALYVIALQLLLGLAPVVRYVECAGLDWETPDRHRREVARVGLARWRRGWDTPAEWRARHALAADVLAGFTRTLARYPARPRLRRG